MFTPSRNSRTTDKGETIGHIPADESYIKYDDSKKPCIEVHKKNHKIPEIVEKLLFTNKINPNEIDKIFNGIRKRVIF